MPNHVTTIITASPAVIAAIVREPTLEEIADNDARYAETCARYKAREGKDWPYGKDELPERFVDFELLVPSPPNKETGGCSGEHDPGAVCWYGWNVENWGTKWNAYSSHIEPVAGDLCRAQFDTAWSHPEPIVEALAKRFPNERIEVEYADEDLGYNVGSYVIENGQVRVLRIEDGSDEANELAAQIKYGRPYAELRAEWDAEEAAYEEAGS